METVAKVKAFDRWLITTNKLALVFLMTVMTVLVFGNVVGRYVFGVSFGWAEELSRFAMIWIAFLGVGLALRYGQLAAVEALQGVLPERARLRVRILVAGVTAAFLIALVILGAQFVAFSWGLRTPVLQMPRGLPYLAVPVGAFLALLHLAVCLPGFVRGETLAMADAEQDAKLARNPPAAKNE
ncbi:MAG TPA: TRAP transporter small permease [Aestuariivirgaceae bacterium]|nr:TRAP transporter small permease [Aestuariivirgaceae bacterium]